LQPIFRGSTSCVTHQETEGDPPLSRAKGEINAPSISLEGAFIVFLVGNLADFHRLSLRLRVAPAPRVPRARRLRVEVGSGTVVEIIDLLQKSKIFG
jgi:hypothetical protein